MVTKVSKNEIDMTSGNLFKKILVFSLPIIFSSVLQLLYNAADLIVADSSVPPTPSERFLQQTR